ncbi:Rubrerythrin [Marinitoga hydrogenitolerans DSM 16785]|uniref:Rubrerythrin n=1 Tax=Marinitoga hydrogenitolerans (strain DSM 16785 / JCM 12826 / AT1271) TaxID=1122195 RepID=A0A1M4WKB5_MARH1|nr:rubrerythrin family protein [Marinitoga hydrogenitolerans]SHE81503.1 Rubrerythrin [Marinitoga hydrogenitolerans DSM 16785]
MSIKSSKTEKNLLIAFIGESQARNRYDFFAGVAKKDGYIKIQKTFLELSENERSHAKNFYKHIEGGDLNLTVSFKPGKIGNTIENLRFSINEEIEEYSKLYPEFARIAEEEGFKDISILFKSIAVAEKHHAEILQNLLNEIETGNIFKSNKKVLWKCEKCGYIMEGFEPPEKCPACNHPKAYFVKI